MRLTSSEHSPGHISTKLSVVIERVCCGDLYSSLPLDRSWSLRARRLSSFSLLPSGPITTSSNNIMASWWCKWVREAAVKWNGLTRADLVGKTNSTCDYRGASGRSQVSFVGSGNPDALDCSLNSNA